MATGQARLARVLARAATPGEADEAWARELGALLEAAARTKLAQPGGVGPARAALAPFLAVAERWLEEELDRAGWACLPSARSDLLALLANRWVQPCLRPLAVEQYAIELVRPHSAGAPEFDSSVEAWVGRFEQYPALAALLPRTLRSWRVHVRELLSRLEQDRGLLADALFGGRALPALAGMRGDAGDAHDGGRSVAVLRFEDGRQVVYKPKDLRVSRAVQDLFAWLNEAGLPVPLPERVVLPRDGYTWEELVPEVPCRTADEVARFYTRMGMQLRLMQLLEARDLTLDNLVASGEHPVFIDTEMVLQPRRAGRKRSRAEELLEESVVPLGILSAVFPLAGGLGTENAGALTPAREFQTDLPHSPVLDALEGIQRASRHGYRLHRVWRHAPTLEGEPVHAAEHLPRLLEGYREMHAFLRAHREALLADSGPLASFSGLKVRYVHRNTAAYMRPLWAGLSPELLAAPPRRRQTLEHMLEATGGGTEEPAVLRAELAALLDMDVPYFLCATDGSALLAPDGQVVREDFFEGSGLERLQRRLRELELFPLDEHEELLRSTLDTSRLLPPRPSPPAPRGEERPASNWLEAALELGERVLAAALPEGDRLSWVGLSYTPFHDHEELAPLGPELLDGTAGLAVVLGELYAASGREPFRAAALGALAHARQALAQAPEDFARAPLVGAFLGIGGQLHALARCAEVLGMPELVEEARARAAALPLEELAAKASPDLVAGTTGLVLALLSCGASSLARALLRGLGQRPASAPVPPRLYPPGSRASMGLPSASEGLALCASRLGEPFSQTPLSEPTTAGALLARVELSANPAGAREPTLAAVRSFLTHPARDALERLEQLEVALTTAEWLGDEESRARAVQLGQRLLSERERSGRWFPERLAAERHQLSALWGLPALAHAFLRLHAPSRFPSLRLVR